ncbi:MAG: hypothetical protein VKP72_13705 [bacterium]|nr:hypothetical protein [bacterium]
MKNLQPVGKVSLRARTGKGADLPMSDNFELQEASNPARKTQVLHANALEERFRDRVPGPTDPDYADYCTWQALKLVEAHRMKRYDSHS